MTMTSELQEDIQTRVLHTGTGGEGYFRVPICGCRNKEESSALGLLKNVVLFKRRSRLNSCLPVFTWCLHRSASHSEVAGSV